jgi:hypothetical protein
MATRHRGFTIVEYSIVGVGVLFPGAAIYFACRTDPIPFSALSASGAPRANRENDNRRDRADRGFPGSRHALHRTGLHRHIVRRLRRIAHHSIVRQIVDTSTLPPLNKSFLDSEVGRYLETAPGAWALAFRPSNLRPRKPGRPSSTTRQRSRTTASIGYEQPTGPLLRHEAKLGSATSAALPLDDGPGHARDQVWSRPSPRSPS